MSLACPPAVSASSSSAPATTSRLKKLTQHLRQHLAALGLVSALMVTLPLVQVLRFQVEQVQALTQTRLSLNPLLRAVHVQRGLLAHRDLSAQVLRGRLSLEPARLQRQRELEDSTQALVTDLDLLHLALALHEAMALRGDALSLTQEVSARSVTAAQSDDAHRLLVEQVLQVMDLTQDLGDEVTSSVDDKELGIALALTRSLPRSLAQLALPHPVEMTAAQRVASWRALRRLHRIAERQPGAPHRTTALQQASRAASISLNHWLTQMPSQTGSDANSGGTTDAPRGEAQAAVLVAHWQLFDLARAQAEQGLDSALQQVRTQRLWTLLCTLLLAGLWTWVMLRVWRGVDLPTPDSTPASSLALPAADEGERPAGGARLEAQSLLGRLREHGAERPTAAERPQAALPPPARDGR